jgi:hypothetical protein
MMVATEIRSGPFSTKFVADRSCRSPATESGKHKVPAQVAQKPAEGKEALQGKVDAVAADVANEQSDRYLDAVTPGASIPNGDDGQCSGSGRHGSPVATTKIDQPPVAHAPIEECSTSTILAAVPAPGAGHERGNGAEAPWQCAFPGGFNDGDVVKAVS